MLTRRAVVASGGLVGAAVMTGSLSGCELDNGGSNTSTQGSAGRVIESEATLPEPFQARLPIPAVLPPVRSDASTDYYQITQEVGYAEIIPGLRTEIWGYRGVFPGPTIISPRGRRTIVDHHNHLPVPVSVHLHGGKTAPEHDGYPTDVILPADISKKTDHPEHAGPSRRAGSPVAGTKRYVYDIDQPAATLWYHDHRMDFTGPQVYRGLAGFHIVTDDIEASLNLPSRDRDIPLMITDRSFAADGSFLYPSVDPSLTDTPGVTENHMSGVLGDCILVNGAPWPVFEVANTRYRFRLLNASNARRYRLRLENGPPLVQIGSDQGLLTAPVEHDEIEIAQAERFDVIVDFSEHRIGDEITMVNDHGTDGTDQVMRFVVTREEDDDSQLPDRLVDMETLSKADATIHREFVFARGGAEAHGATLWTVNGEAFSPDTIAARPRLGTLERWSIRAQNVEHPFHIHLAPFQVIGLDSEDDPGPYNHGWKDTVNLDNGGRAELLIRFEGYRGKYVLHCHNLEHEDMMMMANFEVI